MPNLVAPLRQAILTRYPSATIVGRGEGRLLHALGGNLYALDCALGSLHYHDGSQWQEVNTDWQDTAVAGFTDGNDRHRFAIVSDGNSRRRIYPRRGVLTEYIEFARPQFWTGSAWQNLTLGTRTRSGQTLTWDRPNYALAVTLTGDGVKIHVTLKNSNAAARLRWPVTLTGLSWQQWTLVAASDGAVVAEVQRPILYDANHVQRDVGVSYQGGAVEFTADLSGLVYPIDIDPTLDTSVGATADDGWWRTYPNSVLVTGSWVHGRTDTNGDEIRQTFARFTGVTIPDGSTIDVSYITLTGMWTDSGKDVQAKVRAADAANPAAPTTAGEAEGLTLTTAGVDFDRTATTQDATINTASLNGVVQELVDSYSYAGGAAMLFVCAEDGSAAQNNNTLQYYDYGDSAAKAVALYIEYTAGGGGIPKHAMHYARLRGS